VSECSGERIARVPRRRRASPVRRRAQVVSSATLFAPTAIRRVLPTSRCHSPVFSVSFAACAACFSFRAMFRVCHDLLSVLGLGFSFFCDSRLCGVVLGAMYPLSGAYHVRVQRRTVHAGSGTNCGDSRTRNICGSWRRSALPDRFASSSAVARVSRGFRPGQQPG
jgi:hypothetical protein